MSLWTTSVHEAGHAVTATLLHATRQAGPMTIEPGKAYTGICYAGHAIRPTAADIDDLGKPYPLLSARLRRYHEVRCMILFGGQIAADLHAGRGESEPPPDLPAAKENQVAAAPVLPPREVAILETAAAKDEMQSDVGRAMQALTCLHFDDVLLADLHAAFLARECESILSTPRAGRMVLVLAAMLMRERTISARRWKSILAATL